MYKIIQLTNREVGAVASGQLLPLGAVTRRSGCGCNSNVPLFEVSTTGSNTVTLTEDGYYDLRLNTSLSAGAVGDVVLNLLVNGSEIISSTATATAEGDFVNISISYIIRVLPSCACSVNNLAIVQIQVDDTSVAITGGTANLTIQKER